MSWLAPAPYLGFGHEAPQSNFAKPSARASTDNFHDATSEVQEAPEFAASGVQMQIAHGRVGSVAIDPETEVEAEENQRVGDERPLSTGSSYQSTTATADETAIITRGTTTKSVSPLATGENTVGVGLSNGAGQGSSADTSVSNSAPTDIITVGGTVAENSPAGTVVATLNAVDADSDERFSFNLVDGDTNKFEIQGNRIVVRGGADLDFETAAAHSVDVRVTDSAGNTYTETVDITVQDVADTTITGTAANESLTGTDGAEIIHGFGGDDVINAKGGNDVVEGHRGADKLIGGVGDDRVDGGSGHDTLYGGDGNDTVYGGDAINGKNAEVGGDDTLFGEAGNDLLDGGDGDDTLSGGLGNDVLIGGIGADDLDGDEGIDTASYADSSAGVTVDLLAGTGTGGDAHGDTLIDIENLTGSNHDDTLIGDAGANVLSGDAGNDALSGGEGSDTLIGGAGDDALAGGAGADILFGGAGNDTIHGGAGNDMLSGGAGNNALFGEGGDDLFVLDGVGPSTSSWVDGGAGSDTLDLTSATTDWTIVLDGGDHISSTDAYDENVLADDTGVLTFDNGAEVGFENIENLIW